MPFIKFLFLSNNNITLIEKSSFHNISLLMYFDLSKNNIVLLSSHALTGIAAIYMFNLKGNPLSFDNKDIFTHSNVSIKAMNIDNFVLCCRTPTDASCITSKKPRHTSCSNLLISLPLQVCTLIVVICNLIFNFILLFSSFNKLNHGAQNNKNTISCCHK